jgi:hypothetical protein
LSSSGKCAPCLPAAEATTRLVNAVHPALTICSFDKRCIRVTGYSYWWRAARTGVGRCACIMTPSHPPPPQSHHHSR